MKAASEGLLVERELTIAARPETVWELLVDPVQAVRWMGHAARFDHRPGGQYRVEVIPGHIATGEFVEIDPPAGSSTRGGGSPAVGARCPPAPPPSSSS